MQKNNIIFFILAIISVFFVTLIVNINKLESEINKCKHSNDKSFYREADICYKIAFAQLPNRLYPLYQRMLLYKKMGRKEEAMAMAERIITFRPKIESPATKQMQEEAEKSRLAGKVFI